MVGSGSKVGQRERASQTLKKRRRAREEMPYVARAPQERPRRTTQHKEASMVKDAAADLKNSLIATPSSPEPMSGDEDSGEEEMYTDSLASHITASDCTLADLLTSTASAVEDVSNRPPSVTESQYSTVMPYLEESTQTDQTHNSVFTDQPSQQYSDSVTHETLPTSPPEPPAPIRSARSTKGAPPVHFGKVYTYRTIVSKWLKYPNTGQTLFAPCILNG